MYTQTNGPNDIFELYKFNSFKENQMSQAHALSAVKARSFIVGSINAAGSFSVANNPVTHTNASLAIAEADRLAKLNPGTAYILLQLIGGSIANSVQRI